MRRRYRVACFVGLTYAVLLTVSHRVGGRSEVGPAAGLRALQVMAVDGDARRETPVRLAFREWGDPGSGATVPVVMLHGSPGSHRDFRNLAPLMESLRTNPST